MLGRPSNSQQLVGVYGGLSRETLDSKGAVLDGEASVDRVASWSLVVLKEASWLYAASWVQDIGPDLRPNDYKKYEDKPQGKTGINKEKESPTLEDLEVAARGGILLKVYMTKASSYRNALKNFIQGYQGGIQQVMAEITDSISDQTEDTPDTSK